MSVPVDHPSASWPTGHIGWVFNGLPVFEGAIATFFAEGAIRGERQMLVVEDPVVAHWPKSLIDRGALVIASVAETYGTERIVDASDRLRAWLRWEREAGRLSAENPITGLCAFDRTRLTRDVVSVAAGVHRVMKPGSERPRDSNRHV